MEIPKILKKPIFISKLSKRQLISLASLLIILISLPLAIFLTQQRQIYRGRAVGPEARPTNVKITNLHGGGFSVSWTSSNQNNDNSFISTTGWIEYGATANNLNQKAYDDRGGANFSSTTHHVSIFNLGAEKTYYFKIKSGPDLYGLNVAGDRWVKGGTAKEQKTPKTLELSGNPHPIYGYIKDQTGNKVGGALVYVRFKKDDSETKSALMSTVTELNEGWVMDAKNTRRTGLGNLFDFDNNDRVLIDVQVAQEGEASADFAIRNSSPAPDITLTILPSPSPSPSPTPCSYKLCEEMACVTKEKTPPCPADACTTDANCTCFYKVCEGTTCVTKAQAPPCPPDACSTDTECATPQANLTFKIKFQGINQQKPDKTVSVILKQDNQEIYRFESVGVSSDQNGVYSGTVTNINPDAYDVFIKGWAHLQKRFENITLAEGASNQDWSATILLAGDINSSGTSKGRIDSQDLGIVLENYWPDTPAGSPADLNLDNKVNALDLGMILENYFREDEQ